MRALSLSKHGKPRTIKFKINSVQVEEVLINPKDDLSELLNVIASRYQTIAPSTGKSTNGIQSSIPSYHRNDKHF